MKKDDSRIRVGRWLLLLMVWAMMACLCMGCGGQTEGINQEEALTSAEMGTTAGEAGTDGFIDAGTQALPDPDGVYDSRDDVALYLHSYGKLPRNYITKSEARDLGWEGGSLEEAAPGCCIGGDRFGNYEGRLPSGTYHECDIDTLGRSSRGAKRLVYTDEDIYYTQDHYESFEQLYDKNGAL